ncbi:MAG: endonuclease III [candidate division Zixibacteria bacterium]|nr:endonuclease III [candidate division Zixibacteria bacterium]
MPQMIEKIDGLLKSVYGDKVIKPHNDPVGELIRTILSQNTSDINRDRAYTALRKRFPTWEEIANARTNSIKSAIKPGGLADTKAPRIKEVLKGIRNGSGLYELQILKKMPVEDAIKYLTGFKGVGVKTASCVLLFSFGIKVFPVDTHIFRISRRLELIPEKNNREKAFELLNNEIPKKLFYRLHLNIIELGRKICRARKPLCSDCVLVKLCPSAFSFN